MNSMPMTLSAMAREIHRTAVEHGFWDHVVLDEDPAEMRRVENPSIVPEKLMLITSEVGEAMEAHRDDNEPELVEELADVVIRVLDLAEWKGYDIEGAVYLKMQKNRSRPHMHGRRC